MFVYLLNSFNSTMKNDQSLFHNQSIQEECRVEQLSSSHANSPRSVSVPRNSLALMKSIFLQFKNQSAQGTRW